MTTNQWTFFSNHAHVLISLSRSPEQSLREVAVEVGITERAVQRIIRELEEAGFLVRERKGRRNTYVLHPEKKLRHPLEAHCSIGHLLDVVVPLPDFPEDGLA
jgi:DNA-binding MarR family transcriptional regulator